jgi:hypothetical protein
VTDAPPAKQSARRGIQWDEGNLDENAAWHAANPVTMHIDEPKTPYCHDDGEYPVDSDDDQDGTWTDATYNHLAAKSRHEAPVVGAAPKANRSEEDTAAPEAGGKKPRPKLALPAPDAATEPSAEATAEEEEAVFKHMRKAVYADEGKKFLAMRAALAQQQDDDDDDEDDEAEDNNASGDASR